VNIVATAKAEAKAAAKAAMSAYRRERAASRRARRDAFRVALKVLTVDELAHAVGLSKGRISQIVNEGRKRDGAGKA
jgi:RecA/RadA recombinase